MELWLLTLLCGIATYFWRGLGVVLSGRLRTDSELFHWVECVAYAMIAGLIVRITVMPTGTLADSTLAERLISTALALVAFRVFRKNLLAGVATGVIVMIALRYGRAIF
jgi:branched-subunit amino acid transport protein